MSKQDKKQNEQAQAVEDTVCQAEAPADEAAQAAQDAPPAEEAAPAEEANPLLEELETLKNNLSVQEEKFLRLAAEYDNFRKRTQREKDGIYQDAVADTVKKFLPVYDNLERALHHETADEAYKKGVEMTLTELVKILDALGVKPFGEAGETFDPQRHNAVMHIEDESLGENVIAEVFQTGFAHGDKVIRFAMVKVAN